MFSDALRIRSRKTPSLPRILVASLFVVLFGSADARGQAITEAEAIRLVRSQSPKVIAARAKIAVATAMAEVANAQPNPSLGWERAHLPGGAARSEDTVAITIPLSWNGQRAAATLLSKAEALATAAEAAELEAAAVQVVLAAFYEALMLEAEAAIAQAAAAHLGEAARVVGSRHAGGSTSGYQRVRLELEFELAQSAHRQAVSRAALATRIVAVLLGLDPSTASVEGTLTLRDAAAGSGVVGASGPFRSTAVRALNDASQIAETASQQAKRGWLPEIAVTGGLRIDHDSATHYGYVAGLELTLPLFTRGTALSKEARARAGAHAAAAKALQYERTAAAVHARGILDDATAELATFTLATKAKVELLLRAAQSGYREGELSVVELVDAQRTQVEVDRRALVLAWTAKQAEVALRAAQGEFE